MGHSGQKLLHVYSKCLDDGQGDLEQAALERFIGHPQAPLAFP